MVKKKFKSIFIPIIYTALTLGASLNGHEFEEAFAIHIVHSKGYVRPDYKSYDWLANNHLEFSNGLRSERLSRWKHEIHAEEMSAHKSFGSVNISVDGQEHFKLIHEDGVGSSISHLYINDKFKFYDLPQILSLTERVTKIWHLFYCESQYSYDFELSNGSIWSTNLQKNQWKCPWKPGAELILIGNSQNYIFINKTLAFEDEDHAVKENSFLTNLIIQH